MRPFITLILSIILFTTPAAGNTVDSIRELRQIVANYRQALIDSKSPDDPINRILSTITPETELSDQVVVELHQRYPFDRQLISAYIDSIRNDGSWPDINYNDSKRSGWDAKKHADRILELTKFSISNPSDPLRQAVDSTILKGIRYWFATKPLSKNWWYNEIGVPKSFGPAFLMLRPIMTDDDLKGAIEVMDKAKLFRTGQNKVWLAGNVMIKALLSDDYTLAKQARDSIVSEITTGQPEGIQADWSFHQHGPQQQFGNYGLAFLNEMAFYSRLFAGTSFALSPTHQSIINKLFSEGYRWIVWRGFMDINALDRQLFHNAQIHKGLAVGNDANMLRAAASPDDLTALDNFLTDNFLPSSTTSFTGHKHFWESDQTIHRTPRWMASVKMASRRVLGTELVNEDNLKGFYMADGATYVYRRGDEYLNVFPFWDWRKIPGITSYHTDLPVPTPATYGAHVRNNTDFVCGTTDGSTGITAMILDRDRLHARKSWIFTDKMILCLGAGITSDSTLSLATTIEQKLRHGNLSILLDGAWHDIDGQKEFTATGMRFYHDSICYILPPATTCVAMTAKRTGRWSDFMGSYTPAEVHGEVMQLYIPHPQRSTSSYQYIILPDVSPDQAAAFNTDRALRIIRNDETVQAAEIDGTFYITAYSPARIDLTDTRRLNITTPGVYILPSEGDILSGHQFARPADNP